MRDGGEELLSLALGSGMVGEAAKNGNNLSKPVQIVVTFEDNRDNVIDARKVKSRGGSHEVERKTNRQKRRWIEDGKSQALDIMKGLLTVTLVWLIVPRVGKKTA
ncbi:hypothetical protein L3X38_025903 [Prunus dulcis]|uniref:Uncharacterized protein n=1 Tax=Prunus dulcis TaxID=3755 RepID=A0AAD4Z7V1_PRUDU|nr:hypothetical protein L3X38_025903 [Prunus dulcis]